MEQNQFRTKTVEELSEFFHNLFFLNVSVTRGGVFDIHNMPSFVVSVYKNKNESIIGALLLDIPAAACLAGALCDLPEDMIAGIIASDSFSEDIWGDLQEVLNICSQLFTSYDGDAITLEEVYLHPNSLPEEAFDVLAQDFNPLLFRINIDGYGGGIMGVLDAENNAIFADMVNAPPPSSNLKDDFQSADSIMESAPSTRTENVFFEEDEEDVGTVQPVVQQVQVGNSLSSVAFGVVIGTLIGGLVVKAFFQPEVQIVEVAQEKTPASNNITANVATPKKKFENANEIAQVLVKGTPFHMGCTTEYAGECLADEFPSHSVQVSRDFFIMKHEVTQELYTQVMAMNPSQFSQCGENCPVENISWIQAATFANKLSTFQSLEECYNIDGLEVSWTTGLDCLGWRLPTEAEWELAARGSKGQSEGRFAKKQNQDPKTRTDKDVWVYAGGNEAQQLAWFGGFKSQSKDKLGRKVGTGQGSTQKVCTKAPNDIGLCDMSGNVWEWTWNGYSAYPKTKRLIKDPTGRPDNALKVLRGGSWLSTESELRTSYRMYASRTVIDTMVSNYGSFGMRLIRTTPAVKSTP